jgi:hypothetical protein
MSSRDTDGCADHGARQYLGGSLVTWEGWGVLVEWMTDDDGRAAPVGLRLTGYAGTPEDPDTTGPLHVLSREVTKRLPLARLIDESREAMLRDGGTGLSWVRADTYAADTSTHMGRLARAAFLHAEEVARGGAGSRQPAMRAWERLTREGVTTESGEALTPQRVRTWITEARKRGLYPGPNGKDGK